MVYFSDMTQFLNNLKIYPHVVLNGQKNTKKQLMIQLEIMIIHLQKYDCNQYLGSDGFSDEWKIT